MPIGHWTIKPIEDLNGWKWKLVNREGDLVMISPITFPTEAGARLGAEAEVIHLQQAVLEV
jgi:hypothetical protein